MEVQVRDFSGQILDDEGSGAVFQSHQLFRPEANPVPLGNHVSVTDALIQLWEETPPGRPSIVPWGACLDVGI